MKSALFGLLTCSLLQPALAQTQDVGLTMSGGLLTVIYGQDCGTVTCTPLFGGVIAAGEQRGLTHYSAPSSLYAIAIGFAGPCLPVPGIDNVLLLQNPIIFDWGVTSAPPFVPLPCQQGLAGATLAIPPGVTPGTVFRLQSFGQSLGGQFAFGPAIEATTL